MIVSRVAGLDEAAALELLVSCDGDADKCLALLGVDDETGKPPKRSARIQSTLEMFAKGPQTEEDRPLKVPRLDTKGKTIHVYDPRIVEQLLPCTLHFNVFPDDLADDMLRSLLRDSDTWNYGRFYLFDREVTSGHTACVYTADSELARTRAATYNGKATKDIRMFDDALTRGRDVVARIVNEQIDRRGRTPLQRPGKWDCDIAVVNKYANRTESVGWHSDQLTHLGPQAVIASVSLGVTREFRLKNKLDPDMSTVAVHLPHNSLIIMHAGCQEEWKHSVVPLSKSPEPHPVSGDARINITYRMYPDEFRLERVPLCDCKKPMILRTSVRPRPQKYRYIWQCSQGYSSSAGSCPKIIYPDFSRLWG